MAPFLALDGLEVTVENIRALGDDLDKELARILNEVGQPRIAKIKNRTPVRDGHLRASVHLVPAKRTRQGVEVAWAAGGVATPYAHKQHEDLSYKHKKVGQAKYISSVVFEDAKAMRSELSRAINRLFK